MRVGRLDVHVCALWSTMKLMWLGSDAILFIQASVVIPSAGWWVGDGVCAGRLAVVECAAYAVEELLVAVGVVFVLFPDDAVVQ